MRQLAYRTAPLAVAACVALAAPSARATGFTDIGQDIVPRDKVDVELHGYLRVRGDVYDNLDLNRGLTPSGQPFFPVSLSNPSEPVLTYADMRLRTDLAVYSPMGGVAVKMRADILDNQPLGGGYAGIPAASTTQTSPVNAFMVKRAYGEALTPIGLLAAGRMGNAWGLGILANGGDCADCDSGDAADRLAFITPVLDHILAFAYDFTATGPFVQAGNSAQLVGIEPTTDVHTVTVAILHYKDDLARRRRRLANKTTVEYGAYVSHRWQDDDIPATYLPTAEPIPVNASQVMQRGYTATAMDGWGRLTFPEGRIEAEVAYLVANVDQASLIPGVLYHQPITSNQLGVALESELSPPGALYGVGFDGGYASGDTGPGFGALPKVGAPPPKYGDLYAEATPPYDNHANTFRFHSDYRIDQILFREIVGNVANCVYLRPHARVDIWHSAPGTLSASLAGIASWAAVGQSAPGGQSPLGVEVDPTLAYVSRDGFLFALDYGVLFPMAGLDNPASHMNATTAQLGRVRLMYFLKDPMRSLLLLTPLGLLVLASPACGDNQTYPDPSSEFDAGIVAPLQCVPNLDGTITAAELQEVNGIPVKYLVSEAPAGMTSDVDQDGTVDATGQLVWDWGTSYASDGTIQIQAVPLTGKWYAASFPGGTFVVPFDAGDTIEAVYHEDSTAIWLHGLASTVESPPNGKTLYAYTQPVAVTEFPLSVGSAWTATGTVENGMLDGLPYASQDTYEISDDATGQLILPDLTFTQVHRIRQKVTIDPAAGETIVTYQTSFYFECFGEVARATGQPNQDGGTPDFTTAAEVRRMGL